MQRSQVATSRAQAAAPAAGLFARPSLTHSLTSVQFPAPLAPASGVRVGASGRAMPSLPGPRSGLGLSTCRRQEEEEEEGSAAAPRGRQRRLLCPPPEAEAPGSVG